jgi:membrane-bound lytic murein transglycosylase D
VVGRGQTFSSLAKHYGTSAREIAEANGLSTRRTLRRGTELIIPVRVSSAQRTTRPVVRAAAEEASGRTLAASRATDVGQRISYRVRSGDTLYGIASRFGTTVDKLREWNKGVSSRIMPGRKLTLYTSALD